MQNKVIVGLIEILRKHVGGGIENAYFFLQRKGEGFQESYISILLLLTPAKKLLRKKNFEVAKKVKNLKFVLFTTIFKKIL